MQAANGENMKKTFTLIECTPSKGSAYLSAASADPANIPVQAGSLTCASSRVTGGKGGVTKSPDGKLARFANVRVSVRRHPFAIRAKGLLDSGTSTPGSNERLSASPSGETNTQAVG